MKKPYALQTIFTLMTVILTVSSGCDRGWKQSYHAGTYDEQGNYMGGTETMYLTSHKNKLYAATGMWMNSDLSHSIGPQILVKESPKKEWKLDYQADEQILRVDALSSITLSTDDQGNQLSQPVNLLVAGLFDSGNELPGAGTIAVRDDEKSKWITVDLKTQNFGSSVRAICTHKDNVTGVDHVFIAAFPGGIFRGVYDSMAPGQIRWDSAPEFSNDEERVMSIAECNGELYAAIKPFIYKRADGLTPAWELVYEYTMRPNDKPGWQGGSSGMRGLTAIPNPNGVGEVLLMAHEGYAFENFHAGAKIVYLDPSDNYSVTIELDLGAFLKDQFKETWSDEWNYVITAYNDMERVKDPNTGEDLLLIGGTHDTPEGRPESAWYLVRYPDATYTVHEITYIYNELGSPKMLSGTRTIRTSPFARDNDKVLYFGGFDTFAETSQNTAWIYSADIDTVLAIPENQ